MPTNDTTSWTNMSKFLCSSQYINELNDLWLISFENNQIV